MELRNEVTGEIVDIVIIDPKTGLDMGDDLIGNTMHGFSWNDEHECWETDPENVEWWTAYAEERQEAEDALRELWHELENYVDELEAEKIKDWYNDYIGGVEFNDWPFATMAFVGEKWLELEEL